MIISASYRTDIPAYYAKWFQNRLTAGYVRVKNPYSNQIGLISLKPEDVTGYVFWTRNPLPFLPVLDHLKQQQIPFMLQMTLTDYPRPIEPHRLNTQKQLKAVQKIVELYGENCLVWRYDPILFSNWTPPDWHLETLDFLGQNLAGLTNECSLSIATVYKKTSLNLKPLGKEGFLWNPTPAPSEQTNLLHHIQRCLQSYKIQPTICSQPHLAEATALSASACIDAQRLSKIAGRPLKAKTRGTRPGCLCAESRDIGSYESCAQGCRYCYAVQNHETVKQKLQAHDPEADMLGASKNDNQPPESPTQPSLF